MKNIWKIFIIPVFILLIAACSNNSSANQESTSTNEEDTSSEENDTKDLTFAFSIMNLGNPYFVPVKDGFEDRAKELGIKTIVSDAKYDAATQANHVENYITEKVDAIGVAPIDQNGLQSLFDKAKEEGIFTLGQAQPVDNADVNLIVNEYDYGKVIGTSAAEWINDHLNGEAEVLLIAQDNVETVQERGNGVEDAIKQLAPNAKIVARQTGDTPELAMGIAENVLQSNPNVKVIVCTNDSGCIGAYEAVQAMNMASDDFYIGAADATEEALDRMKEENSIYRSTVDIDPYGTGKKMVDIMLSAIEGEKPNGNVYFDMIPVWQDELE